MAFELFKATTAIKRALTRASAEGATIQELELECDDIDAEDLGIGLEEMLQDGDITKIGNRYRLAGKAPAAAGAPTQKSESKPVAAPRRKPGERERKVLAAVQQANRPIGASEIAAMIGAGANNVSTSLTKLARTGQIKKAGRGRYCALNGSTPPAKQPAPAAPAEPPPSTSNGQDDPIAAQLRDMAVVARKALDAFVEARCAGATYDALRHNAERADEALARHTWERA